MITQKLKHNNKYTVPGKCIYWTVNKHTLNLKIVLNYTKYESGGLTLPPVQLGKCKDWHFELSENTSIFTSIWDIRRVKDKIELIENINEMIIPYAQNEILC